MLPLTIIKKSIVVLISIPHNGTIFSNRSRKFYHRRLQMRDKYQYESMFNKILILNKFKV